MLLVSSLSSILLDTYTGAYVPLSWLRATTRALSFFWEDRGRAIQGTHLLLHALQMVTELDNFAVLSR